MNKNEVSNFKNIKYGFWIHGFKQNNISMYFMKENRNIKFE